MRLPADTEVIYQPTIEESADIREQTADMEVSVDNSPTDLMALLLHRIPDPNPQTEYDMEDQFSGVASKVKMITPNETDLVPPYASYSSWVRLLDALARFLPPVIDETYLASLHFSDHGIKPLRSALRFLGLIGRDDRPTEKMERLVEALRAGGTVKADALKEVIYQAYPTLFSGEFDLKSATTAELRQYFGLMGARGQIQQKCSSFFLNLARDAGLDLSPQLLSRAPLTLGPRTVSLTESRATERSLAAIFEGQSRMAATSSPELDLLIALFPKFDIDWPEERKQRWFHDFVRLMKTTGMETTYKAC